MNRPARESTAGVVPEATRSAAPTSFWGCFFCPATAGKAIRVALVVGPILGLINHFDLLAGGGLTGIRLFKICLTFLVPFCVSGYSSATTLMAEHAAHGGASAASPGRAGAAAAHGGASAAGPGGAGAAAAHGGASAAGPRGAGAAARLDQDYCCSQ